MLGDPVLTGGDGLVPVVPRRVLRHVDGDAASFATVPGYQGLPGSTTW